MKCSVNAGSSFGGTSVREKRPSSPESTGRVDPSSLIC